MPIDNKARLTVAVMATVLMLSGCATVDVTDIGAKNTDIVQDQSLNQDGNVITRAVMRLYDVFVDQGWHEDRSRERVQTAASILLNGLEETNKSEPSLINASFNQESLMNDIKTAHYHISQTTKAAEIYMDVASSDVDLRPELKQLEQALTLSEEAQTIFQSRVTTDTAQVNMEQLSRAIDTLRVITDEFGDVVRTRAIAQKSTSAS